MTVVAENMLDDFHYFLENQEKLVRKYRGKHIVIKGRKVLGAYDSDIEAITETQKEHELGTFIVQVCEPGEDSYIQKFHSRVNF